MQVYKLPPRFYQDHRERDLPEQGFSYIVRETRRSVFVAMNPDAYDELLSDAQHYSEAWQFGPEYRGLCSSARATVKALTA